MPKGTGVKLTGTTFMVLVVLLTVGSFVAAVVLLPRLPGWRPRPVLARVSILLLVNVLTVFSATVALNDQYLFYADWTDLHGAIFGGQTASTSFAGAGAGQAANSPGPVTRPSIKPVLPPLPPGAGTTDRVLQYTITGTRSGLRGRVLVTLPEDYTLKANENRYYPVLETFHGYPGDPGQWIDTMNVGAVLDGAFKRNELGPVITISPQIEYPAGVDTECVDKGGTGPNVETWLTQDVPDWVLHSFRARDSRSSWATIGLSAGGWCAAMATMLHPDRYGAAIVMGGYFYPEFSTNYYPFPRDSARARRYDLVALAKHNPPSVALWVETSHSDPVSYPSTAKLLAVTRPPLSVQALVLSHAGHRISIWSDQLPQALTWLGTYVAGFSPTAA